MKDILIIAHYTSVPTFDATGRFNVIAKKLVDIGEKVELVTSSFEHSTKKQVFELRNDIELLPYKVTLIEEPGYKKNVSIMRIISHRKMAMNLEKFLRKRKKPDVVYCSIPTLSVAKVVARYCKKNNIKFILDVQDLWPEAFEMVLPFGKLNNFLTYPIKKTADFIYSSADEIVAVSKTYCNRALSANKKNPPAYIIYLGTDVERYENIEREFQLKSSPTHSEQIKIAYCGTLGHSYDIKCVIDAIEKLKDKYNIIFVVMGDGPLRDEFEIYAREKSIDAQFTGMLSFEEMVKKLIVCDIVVNPIVKNAAQSIINKHALYAVSGHPVLNTQGCEEYIELVEKENMGLNSKPGDAEELSKNIECLILNPKMRNEQGKNARRVAYELFDRRNTYNKFIEMIRG